MVVDGTGGAPRRADVGIRDGLIVAVGDCPGEARETLDATGALVTPGFIDLHAHYDGQVSWDQDLAPSCFHGVTTCAIGNCGVGFAPVRPDDHERLIALMEGVEDIPGAALAEGIRWNWTSFGDYVAAVDEVPRAMDVALQVPHDALRMFVMGERAHEPATDADIARMRELVGEALDAGAVGFTTGRTDNHRARDGSVTPASEATVRELRGIAGALAERGRGVLQAVSDFDMTTGDDRFDPEFDVLEQMAEASGGRPLALSLSQRDLAPDQWRRILGRVEAAVARGLDLRVLVAPRGIGVMLGYEATFHPFMGFPGYKEIAHWPLSERVAALRDPGRKARILGERSEPLAGDGSAIPPLADKLLSSLDFVSMRMFRLGERPNYEQGLDQSLCAEAQRRGCSPLEAIYDALLEDEGKQLLYFPIFNYTAFNLDAVGEMLRHPRALPGLGDGGAHVGTVCDASFSTYLLMHWGRDRAEGRLPVERLVQMLTSDGARFLGLSDRGRVQPGLRADLNIIDLPRLGLERPRLVRDLPAGGQRLLQDATGYRATLVAGQVTVRDGQLTGARPGRVARG
ncbi:MAG: D-aminoacylase [Myxococcales bacterium]|nr:MAG: D-aminoacylase [Myxococcales bacterium]